MIQQLSSDYPISLLCTLLDISRSSYYYQPELFEADQELVDAIEPLLANKPYLGYRMVLAYLKREGWGVGERPVRRILHQMKHTRSASRLVTTDSTHSHERFPNAISTITPSYPNHI